MCPKLFWPQMAYQLFAVNRCMFCCKNGLVSKWLREERTYELPTRFQQAPRMMIIKEDVPCLASARIRKLFGFYYRPRSHYVTDCSTMFCRLDGGDLLGTWNQHQWQCSEIKLQDPHSENGLGVQVLINISFAKGRKIGFPSLKNLQL